MLRKGHGGKPQQRKKEESEGLRGEGTISCFIKVLSCPGIATSIIRQIISCDSPSRSNYSCSY